MRESFIKVFRGSRVETLADEANIYGENHSCEIIGAQVSIYGGGRSYEEIILTVIYKKVRDRSGKKASAGAGQ